MLWILLALTIIVSFFSIQEIYAQPTEATEETQNVLLMTGKMYENGTTILHPFLKAEGRFDIPLDGKGDVRILYYNINYEKIAETGFGYSPSCLTNGKVWCADYMLFGIRIPDVEGLVKIELVQNDKVLAQRIIPPNRSSFDLSSLEGRQLSLLDEINAEEVVRLQKMLGEAVGDKPISELSEQESIEEFDWLEKGQNEAIKQAEIRDQIDFVEKWIIPIVLISAVSIATALVIKRRKKKLAS